MKLKGDKLYSCYIPAVGCASSVAFSFDVMHHEVFKRIFGVYASSVTNALWFNCHFGVGMYLYKRRVMKSSTELQKLGYCVFGSVIFNFGSLLLLATMKNVLPDKEWFRAAFGMLSMAGLLYTGKNFIQTFEEKVSE